MIEEELGVDEKVVSQSSSDSVVKVQSLEIHKIGKSSRRETRLLLFRPQMHGVLSWAKLVVTLLLTVQIMPCVFILLMG